MKMEERKGMNMFESGREVERQEEVRINKERKKG